MPAWSATILLVASWNAAALALAPGARSGAGSGSFGVSVWPSYTTGGSIRSARGLARVSAAASFESAGCRL